MTDMTRELAEAAESARRVRNQLDGHGPTTNTGDLRRIADYVIGLASQPASKLVAEKPLAEYPAGREIEDPLSWSKAMTPVALVLTSLAAQENCDDEPYDQMMA